MVFFTSYLLVTNVGCKHCAHCQKLWELSAEDPFQTVKIAERATKGKSPSETFKCHYKCCCQLRPANGTVISSSGNRMVIMSVLSDLPVYRHHVDQAQFNNESPPGVRSHIFVPDNSYDFDLCVLEAVLESRILWRSEIIYELSVIDCIHSHFNSTCDGFPIVNRIIRRCITRYFCYSFTSL